MEQSKFSIADLLTLIGGAAFSFICYLGINFLTLGNTAITVISSLAVFAVLFLPAYLARYFKTSSTNFKVHAYLEFGMIGLFVVFLSVLGLFLFPIFFNVSENKEGIQKYVGQEIEQAEAMFNKYETYASNRENQYLLQLKSIVAAKHTNPSEYAAYGFSNSVSSQEQIDNKMFTVHADLFPTNYDDMKTKAIKWLGNAKSKIGDWKAIGVVSVLNMVEKNSEEWYEKMVSYSSVREKGETAIDFVYPLSFSNVSEYFTISPKPSVKTVIIALVIGLVMLMSWIISRRSSRFPGWNVVFSNNSETFNNEL